MGYGFVDVCLLIRVWVCRVTGSITHPITPHHPPQNPTTQVKARGADLIVITDSPKLARGLVSDPIIIPSNGPLTALIATLPLQLLAYELAVLKVRCVGLVGFLCVFVVCGFLIPIFKYVSM